MKKFVSTIVANKKTFELIYQFVLVFNPFMVSGNEKLNLLKQICSV